MTKLFQIRLTPREYAVWETAAAEMGLTISEWVRRRTRGPGRLRAARHPVAAPVPEPEPKREPTPEEIARREAEEARREAEHQAFQAKNAEDNRRRHAEEEVLRVGSTDAWLKSLKPDVRKEWIDLRDYLLEAEGEGGKIDYLRKIQRQIWGEQPKPPKDPQHDLRPRELRSESYWRGRVSDTGILEIDYPRDNPLLTDDPDRLKRRITERSWQQSGEGEGPSY